MAPVGHAFAALRSSRFRHWFFCQILSSSGSMTQAVGQGWLIVQLHGGGLALAMATGALFLPTLLIGPSAGALSDRHDRRTILIVTQCLQAAIAGTAALLTAVGAIRIWSLVVTALAMGMVFAVDAPARQVYVMELAGGERVAGAISLNEVALNASRAVGPAFGGIVIAMSSVWVCFLINALSFLPTLAFLARQPRGASSASSRRPARRTAWAGARYALASPPIRACLLMAATAGAIFNIGVVAPLLATRVFHVGGAEYGLMLAAFGVGAVPGAMRAAASGPEPTGPEVRRLGLGAGVTVIACASAPTYPLMLVGLAAVGAVSIWFIARANALVLLSAEPSMRGRVMGVWSAALPGMNPITGLAIGVSADTWGPRVAYAGVGLAAVLTALAGWRALRPRRAGKRARRVARQARRSRPDAHEVTHGLIVRRECTACGCPAGPESRAPSDSRDHRNDD